MTVNLCLHLQMTGGFFANWWTQMRPYARLYVDVWPGVALVGYLYYKVSYGGELKISSVFHRE